MLFIDMPMPKDCLHCPLLNNCKAKNCNCITWDELKHNCPIKATIPQITYEEFIKWALDNCCIRWEGEADDE